MYMYIMDYCLPQLIISQQNFHDRASLLQVFCLSKIPNITVRLIESVGQNDSGTK